MKLNLKNIINILKDVRNYVFPIKKITNKFRDINSKEDLKNFIQERSAHVTQTTLYGYIKTRIGSRYAMMFEDEVFLKSINLAKWNIYMAALTDCTFYVFSYLIDKKNLKQNDALEIFLDIIEHEKSNGLENTLFENTKLEFSQRLKEVDWKTLDGRWQLLATTIQSQCVEDRTISYSLKNYKKNPKEVLERYRQNNVGKL